MSYCDYCADKELTNVHRKYHDLHYGYPIENDDELFGRLVLEINQAGLSWDTILKKENNFIEAFDGFSISKVARYDDEKITELLNNSGIIRNRLKIAAVIHNAQVILQLQKEYGSFRAWIDANHPKSLDEWTKLFKKTFKFVGGEIVKEFLMSTGYLKGAHDENCEIYSEVLKETKMVITMKKYTLFLFGLLFVINSNAQFGISGGISTLAAFGTPKPYIGLHLGGEIPRDDQVSLYARVSLYSKQTSDIKSSTFVEAIDPINTNPSTETVMYSTSMNYTMLEGGNRFYIGEGYDSGFGAYGGGILMMAFNTVKRKYDSFDESKYRLSQYDGKKGSIFNIGFGLGGGLKHTLAGVGTAYLDVNFCYMILSNASNATASSTPFYTPLVFSFNLGFRKDLY